MFGDACQQETYSYDTNPYDSSFSQNASGRLAAVQYKGGPSCNTTFTEMYSYGVAPVTKRLRVTRGTQTFNLDSGYTYDTEGRMTAIQYPSSWNGSSWVAGANLGNTYDSMGRLQKLTDLTAQSDIISNATYGPAGQLLTMTAGTSSGINETRTYNSLGQLTQMSSCVNSYGNCPANLNVQYSYSATQNNGKITSQQDLLSGEQVTYTYDSLNRLASATGSGWGQSYAYDGFGNLTNQTVTSGTAPALNVTYDPATNRQTGECADANGNLNSYPCTNAAYTYDVENRIWSTATGAAYSYGPGNKRVWRGVWSGSTQTVDEVTYWGVNGQKLMTYQLSVSGSALVATATGGNVYFGGKLISNATGYVTPDRLGSIGKYFPWGQERPSATTDGKEKFATYFRDSETGLDYANNRYHQPGMGRFMTPDPYMASGGPSDPGSWNRYAYAGGDPVNSYDPSGRFATCPPGTYVNSAGTGCLPEPTDCSVTWWLPECGGFSSDPSTGTDNSGTLDQDLIYQQWMQQLAATWNAGLAEAANVLAQPGCAALFNGVGGAMAVLDASNPVELLSNYVANGFMTYDSSFRQSGVQPGGAMVDFGSLPGFGSTWNVGGVTTYANNRYTNSSGTTVSVNSIFLNVWSFAFTGIMYVSGQNNGFVPVGSTASSAAFAGLSQPQITALTIIHELLHAVGAIPSDATSDAQSQINSDTVRKACF